MTINEPGAGLRWSGVSLWTVDDANLTEIRATVSDPLGARISHLCSIPSVAKILAHRESAGKSALSAYHSLRSLVVCSEK